MFTIVNIVVTANLDCPIDLRELVKQHYNLVYKPSSFSAAIWKVRKIGATCLVFNNGKIVCCGSSSLRDARVAVRKYTRILQKLGYDVKLSHIVLQTMTLTYNLGFPINLTMFCTMQEGTLYEPELFPAVMIRKARINFAVFSTGKIIVSGVKDIKVVEKLFLPILLNMQLCQSMC
jgi:transcription initiation factor TFIID TATA-box-binding protein